MFLSLSLSFSLSPSLSFSLSLSLPTYLSIYHAASPHKDFMQDILSKLKDKVIVLRKGDTRGYQKVLSLTWKEPEIWIYSALFFNVVPFQLHTLVPSSYPVINTRSVEVNILVP